MAQGHLILLANFYGSYLNKEKFKATVIINNAGIEQLATLGVDKVKEVKRMVPSTDKIYVLVVAGLTDVLIKSVEQGKNKLEITPNSTQLIESKMQWSQRLLNDEGVKVIWAVMPPISLRMYHQSEGWDLSKIPGMSVGLDKEQRMLNNLMLDYRALCLKLNLPRVMPGPFFTDKVVELSNSRSAMHLNTGFFESDGISPTNKLITDWQSQVNKLLSVIDHEALKLNRPPTARAPPPSLSTSNLQGDDPWALPAPKIGEANRQGRPAARHDPPTRQALSENRLEKPMKRSYDGSDSLARNFSREHHMERRDDMHNYDEIRRGVPREYAAERRPSDLEFDRREKRPRDYSPPPSSIPRLLDLSPAPASTSRRSADSSFALSDSKLADQNPEQLAAAMQLLAATMRLSGGNQANVQSMVTALMSQQQQGVREREHERRLEEERTLQLRQEEERLRARRLEEAREFEARKRMEEERRQEVARREELRRREEERLRAEERIRKEEQIRLEMLRKVEEKKLQQQREDARLREIQIAAKLAMEQQKIEEERKRQASLREQQAQAQLALMAVTKQVRDQIDVNRKNATAAAAAAAAAHIGSVPFKLNPSAGQPHQASTPTALERINEKLKNKSEPSKVDRRIANDESWKAPVVLFSFVNRSNERKPLRGIIGPKISKGSTKIISDYRSRGQQIYAQSESVVNALGYLKIRVRVPGRMSDYERKVADFNNRVYEMLGECESLLMEGRATNYQVRRQIDGMKLTSTDVFKNKVVSSTSSSCSNASVVKKVAPDSSKDDRSGEKSSTDRGLQNRSKNSIVDLRDSIRKKGRARSRTPGDKRNGKDISAPPAASSKPRWDKSDESEDELLWDDEEVAQSKLTIDDKIDLTQGEAEDTPTAENTDTKNVDEADDNTANNAAEDNPDGFVTIDEAA